MLTEREAEFLYQTARAFEEPAHWVEVGVWCGRGMWAACCGLPNHSHYFGTDNFDGKLPLREGSETIIDFAHPKLVYGMAKAVAESLWEVSAVNTVLIHGKSHEMQRANPRLWDVLVIDAAHDYESVCRDIDAGLARRGSNPGGVIIGHDYGGKFHGVKKAFDERFGDRVKAVLGTRFCEVRL